MSVRSKRPRPNINLKVYDTDMLRFFYPEWDTLEKSEKLKLLQNSGRDAYERIEFYNVTTEALHQYLAYVINPARNREANPDMIAFGNDNSSFSASDTTLNNRVGANAIVNVETNESANETVMATFVDSTELNGYTLKELGLETSSGDLWNHAEISPTVDKTQSKSLVVEVYIAFSN